MTRFKLLGVIAGAAVAVVAIDRVRAAATAPRLSWIATAHQFGPVGYRDPAGAISPDGRSIAYSEGRFLRVRPDNGGAGVDFDPGGAQIRTLAWSPDGRRIVADGDATGAIWSVYDVANGARQRLSLNAPTAAGLRQLSWSPDGQRVAAIAAGPNGNELRLVPLANDRGVVTATVVVPMTAQISYPAWTPSGETACIASTNGRASVTIPCGGAPLKSHPSADAYGPLAFSPDGSIAYASLANSGGTVDLWSIPVGGGEARQLTFFDRDTYAPSVAADGSVVFKVQSYRTHVAMAPASGGGSQALATFQSETPSWDPTGRLLGITYGTWRRLSDDAKYPDIAQDAGIIAVDPAKPASAPASVVHDSASEDQSLCWSPNGHWIAFHSHKDMSDDIWLRRATGDPTARRITMLGRGAEAGWPRWSRDGRWLLFTGASKTTHRSAMYLVGIDQSTGEVHDAAKEITLAEPAIDVFHAEWLDAGDSIVAVGKEGPGRHLIFTVGRAGGRATVVHRFASEHDTPGIGVSPDGKDVAFIAPAPDGFFQVFRMPIGGGPAVQVTKDQSNKTQPAWSPDGRRIAFTVWNYDAQFWRFKP